VLKDKDTLIELFAKHSKKSVEEVRSDIERDRYLSAREAVEYGLVDEVLETLPA